MVDWKRFAPEDFEYDFDRDKLAVHGVEFEEAVECFYLDYEIRRDKKDRIVTNSWGGLWPVES